MHAGKTLSPRYHKVGSGVARPNSVTAHLFAELTSPNGGIPWDAERQFELVYVAERCTHVETGNIAAGELETDEDCTSNNGGLRVVSIADTDNPVELAKCSVSGSECGVTGGLRNVRAVELKGNLFYVAAWGHRES